MRFLNNLIPLLLLFTISIYSCKKDSSVGTQAPKTVLQLLTEKTWKADEIRVQLSNNTTEYYKRGSSGNTYDSDSLKFSTNNSGIYYFSGSQYPITWNFTSADQTKMTVVINYATPTTIYLENINLSENYFRYAQYSSSGAISYLSSVTRIPN